MKKIFILAGLLALGRGVYAGPDSARPVSIVHAKVMRDFALRYDDISYARWIADSKGSTMYFIKDGFHNRAVYDLKGRWQHSLIFYDEAKLPRDVRATVKREYFDFDINVAEEVQTRDGKAYLIYLEDQSTNKIVKVNTDGEMDIMEEYRRQ